MNDGFKSLHVEFATVVPSLTVFAPKPSTSIRWDGRFARIIAEPLVLGCGSLVAAGLETDVLQARSCFAFGRDLSPMAEATYPRCQAYSAERHPCDLAIE